MKSNLDHRAKSHALIEAAQSASQGLEELMTCQPPFSVRQNAEVAGYHRQIKQAIQLAHVHATLALVDAIERATATPKVIFR